MDNHPLYLPLLIQVALSVIILFWLAWSRVSRIAKQGLPAIRKTGFPAHVNNASDNFKNQFEVPVLFYALCFFFIVSGGTTQLVIITAWVFVVFRLLHALIQLTKNIIFPYRFLAFLVSALAIVVMLVIAFTQVIG
jgi:hypothetical protein